VNCFVALNRSPSRLEFSESLLGIRADFTKHQRLQGFSDVT
jgi:hypothetical protein